MADFKVIDYDEDGVTDVSLKGLEKYKDKTLEYVILEPAFPPVTVFVFKDHTAYKASGLAYGYGGEGPHGLHKAIRMFSDKIAPEFDNTAIPMLPQDRSWIWYPTRGFVHR